MVEFLRRNQVLLTSGLFLLLSLVLVMVNRGETRRFDPLGAIFLEILRPFQVVASAVGHAASSTWGTYVGLVGVSRENETLHEKMRLLEAERHRTAEIELQNQRLRLLLDFRTELPDEAIAARIVGRDSTGLFESFTLDRGSRDGVSVGMAVVCADGVVGRVAQVSPRASRVLLMTNHNSGIDAIIQRTRARGIVEGVLEGDARMKYLKRTEDVVVGDVVVTSGLDGIYPKGIRIGRIMGVKKKEYGLFQVAQIVPSVDFSRLEEVLIVVSRPGFARESFAEPGAMPLGDEHAVVAETGEGGAP